MHYGLIQNVITITYKGNNKIKREEAPKLIMNEFKGLTPSLLLISVIDSNLKEIMKFGIENDDETMYSQKFQYIMENYDAMQFLPFDKAMSLTNSIFSKMDKGELESLVKRYIDDDSELLKAIGEMIVHLTGFMMDSSNPNSDRMMVYSTYDIREIVRQVSYLYTEHEFKIVWQDSNEMYGRSYYSKGIEFTPSIGKYTAR